MNNLVLWLVILIIQILSIFLPSVLHLHSSSSLCILIPLWDVKYEGDLEMVACPPTAANVDAGGSIIGGGVQDCVDFRTISLVLHASKIVKIVLKILARTDEDCVKNAHLLTLRSLVNRRS